MTKWFWPLGALIWGLFLFFGFDPLPALGPLFDVRSGIWNHQPFRVESRHLSGLKAPVIPEIRNDIWLKDRKKDIQLYEALRIMQDMIRMDALASKK